MQLTLYYPDYVGGDVPFSAVSGMGDAAATGLSATGASGAEFPADLGLTDAQGLAADIVTSRSLVAGFADAETTGPPAQLAIDQVLAAGAGMAEAAGQPGSLSVVPLVPSRSRMIHPSAGSRALMPAACSGETLLRPCGRILATTAHHGSAVPQVGNRTLYPEG